MKAERFPKTRFVLLWCWAMALQLVFWFPWRPRVMATGLDNSFRYALNELFAHGAQFGTDVVVQYGPYGFLKNNLFHPQTIHLLLVIRLLLFVVFAALLARASTKLGLGFFRAVIWASLLVGVARFGEPYFMALAILAFLVFYTSGSSEERIVWSPVALVLALASLMQFTYAILNVSLIAAMVLTTAIQWAMESSIAKSRRGWEPLVEAVVWPALFGVGLLFLWVAAGQELAALTDFLTSRLRLTMDYGTTHSLAGPLWKVLVFVGAAVLFFGVFVIHEVRRSGPLAVPLAVVLGSALLLAYKHSFVRHDAGHTSYGAFEGLCLVLLFGPWMLRRVDGLLRQPPRTGRRLAILVFVAASASLLTYDAAHDYGARFFRHLNLGKTANRIVRTATKPGITTRRHESAKAEIRSRHPLPPLTGPVDVYPWEMSLAHAHDLEVVSRPTLQSYRAGDPSLARANAEHLVRSGGPETLLFRVGTIDSRFPAMDDGPSWPHILARFRLQHARGSHLVLTRRTRERSVTFDEPKSHELKFGEPVELEAGDGSLVWLRAEFNRGIPAPIAGAAFRGPILYVQIELASGDERWYRIVPGMAEAGFLLSPLVTNNRDFAALMDGSWSRRLADRRVTKIEFATEFGAKWYWNEPIRVELATLEIE
jgi:hypothetical protein